LDITTQSPFVLSIDIGSSSLRAAVFDSHANLIKDSLASIPYSFKFTQEGGATIDPDEMFGRFAAAVDQVLAQIAPEITSNLAGVATSSLAANLLGVDEKGNAITPVYTYADTRSFREVEELAAEIDATKLHARTGARLHASYWAPQLLWLSKDQTDAFSKVKQWITLHEYFLLNLFGRAICSYSMASWTGLLDQPQMCWDSALLGILPVTLAQLPKLADVKESLRGLRPEFASRWPSLKDIPFFPAIGDGAASNIGCGATSKDRAALTVGTSCALRVGVSGQVKIPDGLWLYRIDRERGLLGGSLSDGGNAIDWMTRTFQITKNDDEEISSMEPDSHGLTILPFLAGERSPGYHSQARGAITGLTMSTRPKDIFRASMEAIAYRLALIYDRIGPEESDFLIANGRALLESPVWIQIMADVFGHRIVASDESEVSARGAALLALESMSIIRSVNELQASFGRMFEPNREHHAIYAKAKERHEGLYRRLLLT
jgi:gluconokinase